MGGAIFGKASSLRVTLDSLTTKEQTVRLGDTDFLAMVFDLNAQGTPAALTNFLSLLREFNTAVVEALDIGRSGASAAVHMVIAVPYEVAAPAAPVEEQVVEEEE
jgi:hypothetical protein